MNQQFFQYPEIILSEEMTETHAQLQFNWLFPSDDTGVRILSKLYNPVSKKTFCCVKCK